jgi:NADH dehydrogenase FAD-containing subunit
MAKKVLLLGPGPAHLHLLPALAQQPWPGADVAWVCPFAEHVDTRSLAALVAGRRAARGGTVSLPPLAAGSRIPFIEAAVVALDAAARRVLLSDGRQVDYDLLSLDCSPVMDRGRIPGAREGGLFMRPPEHFVLLLDGLWDLALRRVLDVVVVGGGVDAVELALALTQRLAPPGDERARVALVTGPDGPLASRSAGLQERAMRALARRRVTVFRDDCRALEPGAVVLASGARLACDAPLLATEPEPPAWLHSSGLALDPAGWPAATPTLQSASHPEVMVPMAGPPSAADTVLANLRGLAGGGPLQACKAARAGPAFVDLGEGRAAMDWGRWSAQGRWVQWWWQRREARALTRSA